MSRMLLRTSSLAAELMKRRLIDARRVGAAAGPASKVQASCTVSFSALEARFALVSSAMLPTSLISEKSLLRSTRLGNLKRIAGSDVSSTLNSSISQSFFVALSAMSMPALRMLAMFFVAVNGSPLLIEPTTPTAPATMEMPCLTYPMTSGVRCSSWASISPSETSASTLSIWKSSWRTAAAYVSRRCSSCASRALKLVRGMAISAAATTTLRRRVSLRAS
mmetsp:Transcript_7330/g.22349  ORF Transcript_7330/g.22349 Transcript_7330/m.22349 type:complete len:221 (+) Transcript_7330:1060-1722(+)